jgi:hypothetical protein
MNLRFLEKDAKANANAIPLNLRKSEIDKIEEVIANAIRVTRGKPGSIMQKSKTVFNVRLERIEPYPYILEEDTPDQPYIKLSGDHNHPTVLWYLQSGANQKWLWTYYTELRRLSDQRPDENLNAALKATVFNPEYKTKTPPPQPPSKTAHDPIVEHAHQKALHLTKCVWGEEQVKPAWFNGDLNEKLTQKKPKQS